MIEITIGEYIFLTVQLSVFSGSEINLNRKVIKIIFYFKIKNLVEKASIDIHLKKT